jgi:hypothetical protein
VLAAGPKCDIRKIGCTARAADEARLKYMELRSAEHYSSVNIEGDRRYASVEELKRLRELAGKHGISFKSGSWESGHCGQDYRGLMEEQCQEL